MVRDSKYDILFEPVRIGPKLMKNRFYQTPHCTGLGSTYPGAQAYLRAMKAEGGWAVVNTEYCSIHPEGDDTPGVSARLWDEGDVRNLGLMCERAHEYGALVGVELHFGGPQTTGYESRLAPRGVSQMPSELFFMNSCYEMDYDDIEELLGFYAAAADRACRAGFDIINIHANQSGPVTAQFLMKYFNRRTDEYGPQSISNRARFLRQVLERIREKVEGRCAIAVRLEVENRRRDDLGIRVEEEGVAVVERLDDLVDLWDLVAGGPTVTEHADDAGASRFFAENFQGRFVAKVRGHTKKPIVGVGRFTSPDTMVEIIRSGQVDIVGGARPSIADPFLPKKIEEGLLDEIRECIGCNVCISRTNQGTRVVCTQNATLGEEYRRGWHPEKFDQARNVDRNVLIVGAGPAGMECAVVLAKRGMRRVHLVEAAPELGGIMRWIPKLPGLGEWGRVVDYRRIQIGKLHNVQFIPGVRLTAPEVLDYGAEIVICATGAFWAKDGLNPFSRYPIPGADAEGPWCVTPEQVMLEGRQVDGDRVVIYDTEGYFMGVSLADKFVREGKRVTIVTPFSQAGPYTVWTGEYFRLNRHFHECGVEQLVSRLVKRIEAGKVVVGVDGHSDRDVEIESDATVLVTQRLSNDALYRELKGDQPALRERGIERLLRVGDCVMPRMTVADAIFDAHRLAREIDSDNPERAKPYIRENRVLGASDEDYDAVLSGTSVPGYKPSSVYGGGSHPRR